MIKKIKIAEKMVLASSGVTGCAGGGAAGYAFALSNMSFWGKILFAVELGGISVCSAPVLIPAAASAVILVGGAVVYGKARSMRSVAQYAAETEGFSDGG